MSESMHIVHTEASQGWGGQEIRILTEAQGMRERGHRVTLLTPPTARIYTVAREQGFDVVAMPFERKRLPGVLAMRRWLKANPVDVINTHSSTDSWLTGLACASLRNAPPIVRTRHISAPLKPGGGTRWLYASSARRVVTTGESLRRHVIEALGCAPEHVVSIPTGIDLERFSRPRARGRAEMRAELGLPADATVIGIAATLRSWKGHLFLIEAFAGLAAARPDLHLLIAGDGPMRDVLTAKAADSGVNERIHFIGQRSDVPDVLAAMDVFALPSYANEGVPQAIMQAMAMGLAVVSTPVGAIDEVVIDEETGLMCRPQDAADLAAKLERLVADPALRRRLAEPAQGRIEVVFAKPVMVARMETLFREVIAENR